MSDDKPKPIVLDDVSFARFSREIENPSPPTQALVNLFSGEPLGEGEWVDPEETHWAAYHELSAERDELERERNALRTQVYTQQLTIAAATAHHEKLKEGLREACGYIDGLHATLEGLYVTLEDAARCLPEARAEMAKLSIKADAWRRLVQP